MNRYQSKGYFPFHCSTRRRFNSSGKENQKRSEEIAKEISAAANYSMDQSFLDFCSCFYHDNPTIRIGYIRKKVWLKGTQPKYLSKLTFAFSALSIWVRTSFLFQDEENSGYKLKVYSCQNKDYKGIEVKIIMSENDPSNLRLYEAFYIRKCKPTLNSREECSEFADLLFQYFRDHS